MNLSQHDVQLPPLWAGPCMSPAEQAKLDAMAVIGERERAETIAREDAALAASGAEPGSLDDLRVGGDSQHYFIRWTDRNADLVEAVASGRRECCGEHERPGYRGWCSLLGRPLMLRESVEDGKRTLVRCDRCPAAMRAKRDDERFGEWFAELLGEMNSICKGETDVWTGYGYAE